MGNSECCFINVRGDWHTGTQKGGPPKKTYRSDQQSLHMRHSKKHAKREEHTVYRSSIPTANGTIITSFAY